MTSPHPLDHLGVPCTILFVDGNAVWSERGRVKRATLRTGPGFVLHSYDGGTRVFPLAQRQAVVYLDSQDGYHASVRTCNGAVLFDDGSIP